MDLLILAPKYLSFLSYGFLIIEILMFLNLGCFFISDIFFSRDYT